MFQTDNVEEKQNKKKFDLKYIYDWLSKKKKTEMKFFTAKNQIQCNGKKIKIKIIVHFNRLCIRFENHLTI